MSDDVWDVPNDPVGRARTRYVALRRLAVVAALALPVIFLVDWGTSVLVRPGVQRYLNIQPTFASAAGWGPLRPGALPVGDGQARGWDANTIDGDPFVEVKAGADASVLVAMADMRLSAGHKPTSGEWLGGSRMPRGLVGANSHGANDFVGWRSGDCSPQDGQACAQFQFVLRYANTIVLVRTGPQLGGYLSERDALHYLSDVTAAISQRVGGCLVC